jgi:cell division protein FtsZ
MLTPEEAPLVRPLEPVNSFIAPKSENVVSNEPTLKAKEKQSDLFGDLFNANKPKRAEEPENTIIKHTLIEIEDEAPAAETQQQDQGFEFEIKVAETDYVFETPVADFSPQTEVPKDEISEIGLDDNKNDESIEDQLKKSKERILRLKDLSMKLRTTNGLQELENEPAYKRKQMQLQQVQHSSESQVSRFTLSNDEDGSTEIRPNNSFLHDNVD